MKTFATALILATAEAGNYTYGTVLPGHPGGINRNLAGGASGNGDGGALLVGGVATGGLNTGLGGGSTVLINSGVDNNEVDATRFAAAVQGSRKLAGDVAGKLAGVRLANSLPFSASTIGTYGDTVPVVRGRQVDVTEEQLFTQDASTTKTITDVKKRQEAFHTTDTRTDTIYTPGTVTKQRDILLSGVEARPETLSSTRYDTAATSGAQDRARFDTVNADVDVDLQELDQGTKEVTLKDFTVEQDEVTKTRDNFITINKLCLVEYEEEVEETILVDVPALCPTLVNEPIAETIFVDKVALRAEKVGYAVGGAVGLGLGVAGDSSDPFVLTSGGLTSGDGISLSGSDCEGSWCRDSDDSDHGLLIGAGLGLRGYYGAAGLGYGGLNAGLVGAAPVVAKRAYGVRVPKTVLRDNYVTVDVECTKQEEQVVKKTVTKQRKEPCTETVNYQTTVTQDIPRTNVFDVTDSVDVTRQGSKTDTIQRNVAARRIEDAPTSSIEASRTDSSRVRDNLTAVQSVGQQDFQDLAWTGEDKEVSRQNLRYRDVEKTRSHDASIEGTAVGVQELQRQKRELIAQSDLGLIGEDIDVEGRGTNGNILVEADASFVATGGLARRIVPSNGIVGDNIKIQGAPVTTLGGDLFLNGNLGADGAAFAGTGFGGSSIGVGAGTRIADGSVVQDGGSTLGAELEGVDGSVTGALFLGGRRGLGLGRRGLGLGRRGFGGRFGGIYQRGYGFGHGW